MKNKLTSFRKLIIKKRNGSITSLIFGQLFLLLIIIWCLFAFRLEMLNTTFNYIDDSLTTSLLGAALINAEEYGKSNQLVIHDNDEFNQVAWSDYEAAILLSELNNGSDIILRADSLELKEKLNPLSRKTDNFIGAGNDAYDEYLIQSLSAFIGNMNYNISNGKINGTYSVDNKLTDVSSNNSLRYINDKGSVLDIQRDTLNQSFLGMYIMSLNNKNGCTIGINVNRFDIYSLYKLPLAERHVYESPYFTYGTNARGERVVTGWKADVPTTEEEFTAKYKPVNNGTEAYNLELQEFEKNLIRFRIDRQCFEAYYPDKLVCYTDTHTTYQGDYEKSLTPFNYFYSFNGTSLNNTANTNNADLITAEYEADTHRAPIDGYSVFTYTPAGTTFNYYNAGEGNSTKYVVKLPEKNIKMAGTEIENTSLYAELTFTIQVFPDFGGLTFEPRTVTVARLIDIAINQD